MQRGALTTGVFGWYSTATRRELRGIGSTGIARGIALDGASTFTNTGQFFRRMQVGARKSEDEGSPGSPSLELNQPGFWSFRWVVRAGDHDIWVNVKQAANGSPRPSLVVKANAAIGVAADQSLSAASGSGWVTIGPVSITATDAGALIVELWNNSTDSGSPCFFDHIVTR